MKFSVIIPAFNEQDNIGRAIGAVLKQDIGRENFEIIVVNNNSTDRTSEVAKSAGADKVVLETKQGTNFARQLGYAQSQGEVIVFLDADSIPPPNWLDRIEKDLRLPDVAAVSGPFDYGLSGIKYYLDLIYTRQILTRLPKLLQAMYGKKAGVIIGGNFAVWRKAMRAIGGLPPLAFWGDDAATAMLISRKAGKVLFDPDLRIKSSPRRLRASGFFKLSFKYAKAYMDVYFHTPGE